MGRRKNMIDNANDQIKQVWEKVVANGAPTSVIPDKETPTDETPTDEELTDEMPTDESGKQKAKAMKTPAAVSVLKNQQLGKRKP